MTNTHPFSLFLKLFRDNKNDNIGEIGRIKIEPSDSFLSIIIICKQSDT